MDDGLLSALGEGFRGMGAVASPQVAKAQEQERANALPNLIRRLQVSKAVRGLQADQAFQKEFAGMNGTSGFTNSSDLLTRLQTIAQKNPSVLDSDQFHSTLQMAGQMQQREALQQQRDQAIQFRYDQLDQQARIAEERAQDMRLAEKDRAAANLARIHLQEEMVALRKQLSTEGNKPPAGYRRTSDGNLEYIPGGPADPKTKEGKLGNRESVFLSRVMTSANEAAKDLSNVVRLPMTASSGVFGGRQQGTGLFDATKEVLANKLTSQEVQSYNVRAAGFQRSLAAIEAAGLAPSGTLSHQMDAVIFKEGDTNFTKLEKLAQTRQIVEAGLETAMSNPRVPEQQLDHMKDVLEQIKKAVPFTIEDLDRLRVAQRGNPKATLKDVMAKMDQKPDVPMKNAKGWELHVDAKGNKAYVSPDGKEYEEVK